MYTSPTEVELAACHALGRIVTAMESRLTPNDLDFLVDRWGPAANNAYTVGRTAPENRAAAADVPRAVLHRSLDGLVWELVDSYPVLTEAWANMLFGALAHDARPLFTSATPNGVAALIGSVGPTLYQLRYVAAR